jgi:hypothetical protein
MELNNVYLNQNHKPMTKQEYIQQKWTEAGFVWNEIKYLVNVSGFMSLPSPKLKRTLTGYDNAHSEGLIAGIGFNDKGFVIALDSLRDKEKNNGWTKIESRADLPKEQGMYLFRFDGRNVALWHDEEVSIGGVTHWRPITEIPNPLY